MAVLFQRKCVLLVGPKPPDNFVQVVPDALRIEDLRIDFKIEKDDRPQPNNCEVSVFNLSEQHRGQLNQQGVRVVLMAGYVDTVAQIFSGDARYVNSEKVGQDWVTKFELGDGERAYSFARLDQSFGPGTSFQQVMKAVIGALQLDPGNALQVAAQQTRQFVDGYSVSGLASTELTRLLDSTESRWSIQDGRIEVLKLLEATEDEVPLISAETGMVGSPEYGTGANKKGPATLKVKSLLQPRLRPGQKFQLRARARAGTFKVVKVVHRGSTHGGDWFSEIEAISIR